MVKNLRKGKPGAGAWQLGEGAGHGTSPPGTAWTWHCEIRGEHGDNSGALPCVKSPVSRTAGTIYVVTRVENVLVRTPWKETRLELERASVETTKGWNVSRKSDGKRVG